MEHRVKRDKPTRRDRSLIINIGLVASCWFISLHSTWSHIFWTECYIVHTIWIKFLNFLLKELYCFTLIFKHSSFTLPYFRQLPYTYLYIIIIIIIFDWIAMRWSRKEIDFPTLLNPYVYSFSKFLNFNEYFSETDSYCSVKNYCLIVSIQTEYYQFYWY